MFGIFATICRIWAIMIFVIGLAAGVFLYTQHVDAEFPGAYTNTMTHLLHPFIQFIRDKIGTHYTEFKGQKFEMAYGVFIAVCMGLFLGLMGLNNMLMNLERGVSRNVRQFKHKAFMHKMQRVQDQAAIPANIKQITPEAAVVVAIEFQNLDRAPTLEQGLQRHFHTLDSSKKVYIQDNRAFLQFISTLEALNYLQRFQADFASQLQKTRTSIDHPPSYTIAVHSLPDRDALFETEKTIWSLLKVAGHQQICVTPAVKEQYELQTRMLEKRLPLDIDYLGQFSILGHRTLTDVYRLTWHNDRARVL